MRNFCWIFIVLLFISCGTEDKKETKSTPVEAKISNINFFMETSGSMAGYMKGATDFVKTIPNLLIAVEKNIDSGKLKIHNYFISDTIAPFNGSTEDFIYAISTKPVAKEKSSEMHKIFQMIADKTDSNDISMFVSDCILSYSDKEIKSNPEINRDKAEGGLKPFITSAFNQLQKKNDMCASLYGFNSDFDGIYYTYQNGKIPIKKGDVIRPYYLWVIGNRALLTKFNEQLSKLENFKPDIAMNFGIFDEPVKDYNIFFQYKKSGSWHIDLNEKEVKELEVTKKKPAAMAVGVNLSTLPPYAKDTNYLHRNLKLSNTDANFKIISIISSDDVKKEGLKKNEMDDLASSTHIFIIEIDDLYKPKADLTITLPLQYDTSYKNISIMDDRNKADISGKTFAFEHLVDGVRTAYQNSNQNYITISIPVKK